MEIFVIILLLALVIAAFIQPMFGLYAFFIIAYTRPQDFYSYLIDLEPAKWILVVTFISFLFNKIVVKSEFVRAKQNWALLGILICVLISRIKAVDTQIWWNSTLDFIRICMVYFMLINFLNTPKKLKSFYIFFLIINLIVALRFYLSYRAGTAIFHGSKPGDMSMGFLANADDLGIGLVMALPLALLPIFYAKSNLLKGLSGAASGCFMLAALATHSRGAHLGIMVIFITALLFHIKWNKLKRQKFFLGVMLVLLLFSAFIYKYRYTLRDSYNSAQAEEDSGRIGRFAAWNAARMMIQDSPVIGIGKGNFVPYWKANYAPGVYGYQVAHNIIYQVTAEIGIAGLLFFLFFSLCGVLEVRKIKKKYKSQLEKDSFLEMVFMVYLVGLIGFYTNGMFITVAFYWHIYVLVALFVVAKNIFMKEIAYAECAEKK